MFLKGYVWLQSHTNKCILPHLGVTVHRGAHTAKALLTQQCSKRLLCLPPAVVEPHHNPGNYVQCLPPTNNKNLRFTEFGKCAQTAQLRDWSQIRLAPTQQCAALCVPGEWLATEARRDDLNNRETKGGKNK